MTFVLTEKGEKKITVKVNKFELCKLILDTNMPITDDMWKFINDMDLEYTDRVVFITKDGKELEFVKTVEAEPIRHGHWCVTQAYPHTIYCSECFTRFAQAHWQVWEDGSLPRDYRPNCGAKMDIDTPTDPVAK